MRTRSTLILFLALFGASCGGVIPRSLVASAETAAAAAPSTEAGDDEDRDFPERDEIHKTFELAPGATVEIQGINGSVVSETASGNVAEVTVVRSAKTRDALSHRRVFVEGSSSSLRIKGEDERGRVPDVRQRVMVKLPRSIELTVHGVNGRVSIGELDGEITVNGINGAVDVAHATSTSDISGINGRVRIGLERIAPNGMSISGVNGKIELHFAEAVNADVSVSGINGSVFADGGRITVIGKMNPNSFNGRIGNGGPRIEISGVNGNVDFRGDGAQ